MLASALAVWAEVDPLLEGTGYHLSLAGPYSCRRTVAQQGELWRKGRQLVGGRWKVVGPVVTKCDGVKRLSNHQPGRALDCGIRTVDPTPGMGRFWWDDPAQTPERVRSLFCLAVGTFIKHGWRWGGDWQRFPDRHHFELPAPKPA